jgi:TRAP-type C4-dicarboxylate transport system substrate-binding protein
MMMKINAGIYRFMFYVFILFLCVPPLFANGSGDGASDGNKPSTRKTGATQIKMASLVPEASPWGAALNELAAKVKEDSHGSVEIIVYHGGVAGIESDVVRKLKQNQVQAAVLTSFGMNLMTPEVMTFSCPFLIRNDAELDYVLEKMKPVLVEKIEEKGYMPIAISKVGFVKIFSRIADVRVPEKLKATKMSSPESETTLINVFKSMGYSIVPIANEEVLIGLKSGRIDGIYLVPIYAANLQFFAVANTMLDFNLAPALGGIFMNQVTWGRLNAEEKAILLKRANEAEMSINGDLAELEKKAMDVMVANGLDAVVISDAEMDLWHKDMEKALPQLLGKGKTFDPDLYNQIVAILAEYRARK